MPRRLILASGSATRRALLGRAGLEFETATPGLDEAAIRASLSAEGAGPRDIADALAEAKARRAAGPDAVTIGADQVLELDGEALGKPEGPSELRARLLRLRGRRHSLLSAVVVHDGGAPVWRHVGVARLTMRDFSDAFLDGYLARGGEALLGTVGGYLIEAEGVRLFTRVEGDWFTVLGLPMLALLDYLGARGWVET